MKDEKRLLMAVVFSVAILVAWQLLFPPPKPKPKQTEPQKTETPVATGQAKLTSATSSTSTSTAEIAPTAVSTSEAQALNNADLEAEATLAPGEVVVETDLYRCVIYTNGGGIKSFDLKKFGETPNPKSERVKMVVPAGSPATSPLTAEIRIGGMSLPADAVFVPDKERIDLTATGAPKSEELSLSFRTKRGLTVARKYTFTKDLYNIQLDIQVSTEKAATTEASLPPVMPVETALRWNTPIDPESAKSKLSFYGMIAKSEGSYVNKRIADLKKKGPFDFAQVEWAGFADSYFLSVITLKDAKTFRLKADLSGTETDGAVTEDLALATGELRLGEKYSQSFNVFIGPKDRKLLLTMGKDVEDAIGYGRLKPIVVPLISILRFFHTYVYNWGLAIILLTIFVKVLFFPLTQKSFQQMKALQMLQPKIKEIQQKYKDDREKMNAEMMSLYRTHKVNPLGGCLPMLLQLPVLYALYRALYVSIELRHSPFVWWINDLSSAERIFTLPIMGGVAVGIMPLIMGASMYVQQKMTPTTVTDPMQARMFMMMPVIFTLMSFGFPSGLVLYWFVSNLLTIIQQYVINRRGTL